jgi:subtilase family serine protease
VQALTRRNAETAIPTSAAECATAYPSTCLTPNDLNSAYFPGETPQAPASEPQTIALVDAYNDLNVEADLGVYAEEFGLPPCTKANGCFKQVGEDGSEADLPFPRSKAELETYGSGTKHQRERAEEAEGWALETATDVEVAHAVCQNCQILLVEASGPEYPELEAAENRAAALHATEISNSWGGESGGENAAFDHPGIAIAAAAGDDGYLNWDQYATRHESHSPYFEGADYPASSPDVISVGGTRLNLTADGAWESESAWNSEGAGGSGCGTLAAPAWQRGVADWAQVGCGGLRANADVAADADPSTGVDIYDSTPYPNEGEIIVPGWSPVGGTSVASPIIASMVALAGGAHGVAFPAQILYSHLGSSFLHDVTTGGNGACDDDYSTGCSGSLSSPLDCGSGTWICNATTGYDGPTGVGTPNGIGAFRPTEALIGAGEEPTPAPAPNPPREEIKHVAQPGGTSAPPAKLAARISALTLTASARAAVRHARLALARIAFSFSSSQAAQVRATLALRVGSGRHTRWRALRASLAFAAIKGINHRRLHGSGRLASGLYRLTLTPTGGAPRSIMIRVL